MLQARGTDATLNHAGMHETKYLKTEEEKVPLKIKGLPLEVHSIEELAHRSTTLRYYKLQRLKQADANF